MQQSLEAPLERKTLGARPKRCRVALAGQPNVGKTSLFNCLTGAHHHVGNYPGVTVEKRVGTFSHKGVRYELVNLPGTYSLSAQSPEERIAEDELTINRPDVAVVVVDATNLVRGLRLFGQILHTGVRPVLCLNLADEARSGGQKLDLMLMRALAGCPVVETSAKDAEGIDALRAAIAETAVSADQSRSHKLVLGELLGAVLGRIEQSLEAMGVQAQQRGWYASQLLQGTPRRCEEFRQHERGGPVLALAETERRRLESIAGQDVATVVAEAYHAFAAGLAREVTCTPFATGSRALSDRIDRAVMHPYFGLPLFVFVMYSIFALTFTFGEVPVHWIEAGFGAMSAAVRSAWPAQSLPALRSMVTDGVIAGVGGVIVFLPNIALLFLGLAMLEDTGYMARGAFLMDRWMHRFGLHGKSFLPMLTGFGCSVPGIMATRTLENERDRLVTMLVLPLISCGARLPIWMLLVPAFFPPALRPLMLGFIYGFGVLLAFVVALVLRRTVFAGDEAPFVMELPPYRWPTLRALLGKMGERSWMYVRKAGTVILGITIVLWFVTSYPKVEQAPGANIDPSAALSSSIAGQVGHALEPVLAPLGFDWKIATGMIGAFAAKEVFVAEMGIVHSLSNADEDSEALRDVLAREYTPLQGLSLMLFLLVATPCMATVAVVRRESGSWKWALGQFFGLTLLAYVISLLVYQGGRLLGF